MARHIPSFPGLSRPYFDIFLDDRYEPILSNWGSSYAAQLRQRLGAAPAATYQGGILNVPGLGRVGVGSLPHVRTSPGVYESSYRLAGVEDPRQAKWDAMLGIQNPQAANSPTSILDDLFSYFGA